MLPKESDFSASSETSGSGKPISVFPSSWIPDSHHGSKPDAKEKSQPYMRNYNRVVALSPYQQALNLSDVESCVALENACFPPSEAASREKVSRIALGNERESKTKPGGPELFVPT
jgi:hypothetical protein